MRYSLLCPGPSLAHVPLDEPQGIVVAINTAIRSPHRVDVFSAMDGPKRMPGVVAALIEKHPLLWVTDRRNNHWTRVVSELGAEPLEMSPLPKCAGFFKANKQWDWMSPLPHNTAPWTLMRAITEGATEIVLYGCDMAGEGYFRDDVPSPYKNLRKWLSRWEKETEAIERITRLAAERGIEVRRYGRATENEGGSRDRAAGGDEGQGDQGACAAPDGVCAGRGAGATAVASAAGGER